MTPAELIYFSVIALALLIIILLIAFIFRKRKKCVLAIIILLIISYISYIAYYPTLKIKTHAERYIQLETYLNQTYPNQQFSVTPEHFEPGYTVGQFSVHAMETPQIGVDLRVDKQGKVTQVSTWTKEEYPTQENLWKVIEFHLFEEYTLDKNIPFITKKDYWFNGDGLTVFALKVNDSPAIAVFTYSTAGYSLRHFVEGKAGEMISIETEDFVFAYMDEKYTGEAATITTKSGEQYVLNPDNQKMKLTVIPIAN
ncbi:LPXTG cell wall anchor domain-containing protein [Lysinibacillus sp. CTST325]